MIPLHTDGADLEVRDLTRVFGAGPVRAVDGVSFTAPSGLLTGFGIPRATVAVAVPLYRLAQYWLPIPIGAACYFTLRVGPASLDRARRLDNLRKVAVEAAVTSERRLDWAERHGHRATDPTAPLERPAGRESSERTG